MLMSLPAPRGNDKLRLGELTMFTKTLMALTATAWIALGAATVMPASAQAGEGLTLVNYAPCYENPSAAGCPGYYGPEQNITAEPRYRHAAHRQHNMTRQHG
jgi:hypothetical protein